MFLDERVEKGDRGLRLILACIVSEQTRWKQGYKFAQAIFGIRPKRRLKAIHEFLEQVSGFAVVTYANLPPDIVTGGEINGTSDISAMSRSDNLWSQVFLAAVTSALACIRKSSVKEAEIDVFYDRKSLTSEHKRAMRHILEETLPCIACEDPNTHATDLGFQFRFQKFDEIPKCNSGLPQDVRQTGTALAHHLCVQSRNLLAEGQNPRLIMRNATNVIMEMISEFVGDISPNRDNSASTTT
jgi:hypothetical protein